MTEGPLGPPPGDYPPPPGGYPPPPPGGYPPPPAYPPPGYPPPEAGYPQPSYGYVPPPVPYASFGARLGAYLLDVLIAVGFFLPAIIALLAGPRELERCTVNRSGDIVSDGPKNAVCEVPTGATWAMFGVLAVAAAVGWIIYWAKLEGGTGQTVGKKALGIATIDIATGQPIGAGRAVGRFFARLLSGWICYLGYLWMLWDPQKQTWHDKIVSSVVVKR